MTSKSYVWSVKRYRCPGDDRNDLQNAMDGPLKGTGDLETIGMICKSYGLSVKRYR